jgi:hypothetical protein
MFSRLMLLVLAGALTLGGCKDGECASDKDCDETKVCRGKPGKCVFPSFGWGDGVAEAKPLAKAAQPPPPPGYVGPTAKPNANMPRLLRAHDEDAEPGPCEMSATNECPAHCDVVEGCDGKKVCLAPVPATDKSCGDKGSFRWDLKCCAGLARRCGTIAADGRCTESGPELQERLPMCLTCGNRVCDPLENRCNCPEDCAPKEVKTTVTAPAASRKVLSERAPDPEIAQMAQLLETYAKSDRAACARIPPIEQRTLKRDGEELETPSRDEWLKYCEVLVIGVLRGCDALPERRVPNLRDNCKKYFQGG